MKSIEINFSILEATSEEELNEQERNLVLMARKMTANAYAPYSEFHVGAALLLKNGEIISGSNQENAAYPSGLCAERVAIFAASANFPGIPVKTIAISAKTIHHEMNYPVSPCGACRQVLLEYEVKQKEPIKLLLTGVSGSVYSIEKVEHLLPLSFKASDLGRL